MRLKTPRDVYPKVIRRVPRGRIGSRSDPGPPRHPRARHPPGAARTTASRTHVNVSAEPGTKAAALRPPPSPGEGPAAGRSPMRHRGTGGSARRGPAGPAAWRPLSVGPREGLRGWHPGWGPRAPAGTEAAAQAGRARGPGGAARARAAAGCGLTSPGTAPSTPSRYSGRVRAAAGRCWRRG